MDGPEGTPVAAYAAALRKATDGYFGSGADIASAPAGAVVAGGTQVAMAEAMGISPSVFSRWLSGKRVAPLAGLHAIRAFLEARSFTFPDGFWGELDELCGRALFHSGAPASTADRLAYLEAKVPGVLAAHERAAARAQSAERACQVLQKRITEQSQSLLKAQCYIRNMETDVAEQKKRGDLLRTELDVLSEQNRRLLDEKPAHPAMPYYVYIPVPSASALEPVAAARVCAAAGSAPVLAYAGPAAPLGTTLLAPAASPGSWYPDVHPGEPIPQYFEDTEIGPSGYPERSASPRYPDQGHLDLTVLRLREAQRAAVGLHDATGYGTGTADLHYAAAGAAVPTEGCEGLPAGPDALADDEPPVTAPASLPASSARRADDEQAPQPFPEPLPGHTALAPRVERALPAGAAVLASLLCAALLWVAAVVFGKLTDGARK